MNDNKRINAEKAAENCGWMVPGDLGADGVLTFVSATHRAVMFVGDDGGEGATTAAYSVRFSNAAVAGTLALSFHAPLHVFRVQPYDLGDFVRQATQVCHELMGKHVPASSSASGLPETVNQSGEEASRIIAALPQALQAAAASAPTIREALIKLRRGQDKYRAAMEKVWGGRCPVTGIDHPAFLVASHAKPWADSNSVERLDPYNGILLAVHIDRLFDGGWIAFADDGTLIVSPRLPLSVSGRLLANLLSLKIDIQDGHRPYLAYHRNKVFQR